VIPLTPLDAEPIHKRQDKALAETAALLVTKKKVQEIWGEDEEDDAVLRSGR